MDIFFFSFLSAVAALVQTDINRLIDCKSWDEFPNEVFGGYRETFNRYGFVMVPHPVDGHMYLGADYNKEFSF